MARNHNMRRCGLAKSRRPAGCELLEACKLLCSTPLPHLSAVAAVERRDRRENCAGAA